MPGHTPRERAKVSINRRPRIKRAAVKPRRRVRPVAKRRTARGRK